MNDEIVKPTGLTVNELIAQLTQLQAQGMGNRKVSIPIATGRVTMGGQPRSVVVGMNPGFDWNSSSLFLETDQPLGVTGGKLDKVRDQHHRAHECLYRFNSILSDEAKPDALKLRLVSEVLANVDARYKANGDASVSESVPLDDLLTEAECDAFRRTQGSFNTMIRMVYQAGLRAGI